MRIRDIDFPELLLDAQKSGGLVVFAGAGVSVPAPSNYPDFNALAEQVAGGTLPKEQSDPTDRFLGKLTDRGVRVHERVRQILSNPTSAPNAMHSDLLLLFGEAQRVRLVTTNFDLHFTTAARKLFQAGELEVYSAPALPVGDSFFGVVHLHGSVDKPVDRLVLTDSDFGRAYLTEGWARRFLQRLFAKYVVLFVGYGHNDTVMNYLARGLPPASGRATRFALTPQGQTDRWKYLGIIPVTYPLGEGEGKHRALPLAVSAWATLAGTGALDHEQKIKQIVQGPVPLVGEELDYIESVLKDASTVRFFARYAKTVDWLHWIENQEPFTRLFRDNALTSEIDSELAYWFARDFACDHHGEALGVLRRRGQAPRPLLWTAIAHVIFQKKPAPQVLKKWIPLLIRSRPHGYHHDFLEYILHDSKYPDDTTTGLLLFQHLTMPDVLLQESYFRPSEGVAEENVNMELTTEGGDPWLDKTWLSFLKPNLEGFADRLVWIVTSNLQQAYLLLDAFGKLHESWDPLSSSRGLIESTEQGTPRNGLGVLIDAARDILEWNIEHRGPKTDFLIDLWFSSECRILKRVAIFGVSRNIHWSPDKKIAWVLSNNLLYAPGLKHEVFLVLKDYGKATEDARIQILDQVAKGPESCAEQRTREYEIYNLLSWLAKSAPDCPHTKERLDEVIASHPDFAPREHPDMDSWIGSVHSGWISPVDTAQLLSKPPQEHLETLISYQPRSPFGASREGLLQTVGEAVRQSFDWGLQLADASYRRKCGVPIYGEKWLSGGKLLT